MVLLYFIPALTHSGRAFCPNDLKLTFCQLSHITVDNKETGGRDRESYGGTYYNKSTTCWLFVQVEGERKLGGGVKGREPRPSANGGSNLRVMKA